MSQYFSVEAAIEPFDLDEVFLGSCPSPLVVHEVAMLKIKFKMKLAIGDYD